MKYSSKFHHGNQPRVCHRALNVSLFNGNIFVFLLGLLSGSQEVLKPGTLSKAKL